MIMKAPRSRGFSLIELMVAMVLGLILSAGIFTVFNGNKQSADLNATMADMQESARFALNQLSSDIRMAGYQGCKDINRGGPNILARGAPTTNLEQTATVGSLVIGPTNWTPAPPGGTLGLVSNSIADTHALTLQFGSNATFPLTQNVGGAVPSRTASIPVDTTAGVSSEPFNIQTGEFALISNCTGSDLIKVSGVSATGFVTHTNASNTSNSLSFDFLADRNTKFMRFNSNRYYVGDTGTVGSDGTMITGLYQQKLPYEAGNPPVLMISGVENMRIVFGVRTGTDSFSYLEPNSPDLNPEDIETIKIGLLMVSEDPVFYQIDERTYTLAGQAITAGTGPNTHPRDERYRQAFNTVVSTPNNTSRRSL